MFLNNRKKITSCFDGLNIPSYLAYSTFLVITNRDFYGLVGYTFQECEGGGGAHMLIKNTDCQNYIVRVIKVGLFHLFIYLCIYLFF